ncbi:MAG: outer membrane beta-barrel protein [Bacteroidales bacterium]
MKRILLLAIIATISLTTLAGDIYKGEHTVGVLAGYNTRTESAVAGAFFQYRFSKYIRVSPDFQYAFSHNGLSSYEINGNIHVPFTLGRIVNVYPLAGVSYQSLKMEALSENRFGLNLGGGAGVMATNTLKLSLEGKYSLLKDYSNAAITLSIGYLF